MRGRRLHQSKLCERVSVPSAPISRRWHSALGDVPRWIRGQQLRAHRFVASAPLHHAIGRARHNAQPGCGQNLPRHGPAEAKSLTTGRALAAGLGFRVPQTSSRSGVRCVLDRGVRRGVRRFDVRLQKVRRHEGPERGAACLEFRRSAHQLGAWLRRHLAGRQEADGEYLQGVRDVDVGIRVRVRSHRPAR